jgi:hypothetical protein
MVAKPEVSSGCPRKTHAGPSTDHPGDEDLSPGTPTAQVAQSAICSAPHDSAPLGFVVPTFATEKSREDGARKFVEHLSFHARLALRVGLLRMTAVLFESLFFRSYPRAR